MGLNVLIVEDQFIEANELKLSLQGAGHRVCGTARTYNEALDILDKASPQIVLVDIFLNEKSSGLDLAMVLTKRNMPFIYISANSSSSILEAAKATRPYGFLIKPYREKDLLVALEIASYRHQHACELVLRQEQLLTKLLYRIIDQTAPASHKLLQVVKTLAPYIPFDYVNIDIDITEDDLRSVFCYRRIGYEEYEFHDGIQIAEKFNLNCDDYKAWRKDTALSNVVKIESAAQFEQACRKTPFLDVLRRNCAVKSRLIVPLLSATATPIGIRFYSCKDDSYNQENLELISALRVALGVVLDKIRSERQSNLPVAGGSSIATSSTAPVIAGIIGRSPQLLGALDQATQVAAFDTVVLILGETGVGKGGVAQAIHEQSPRCKKPMVKINCAAIPATLIESELFGHERGAFTGATERRIGKFEQANGGTIFLDEIGDLPIEIQPKLLRVLQEKEFERLGGRTTIKADVRVIAATNRNLTKDIAAGKFRMDLYYRINVFPICLPPLRERKDDISLLAGHFLHQRAVAMNEPVKNITGGALRTLMAYSWPGNVRELQHVIERHVVLNRSLQISSIDLPAEIPVEPDFQTEVPEESVKSLAEVDRHHIIAVLRKCNGRVSGKGGAAALLNMPATTLTSKMKKLGIVKQFATVK